MMQEGNYRLWKGGIRPRMVQLVRRIDADSMGKPIEWLIRDLVGDWHNGIVPEFMLSVRTYNEMEVLAWIADQSEASS